MKIAVLGLWHLGEVYSAGLAELGHVVFGVSDDAGIIKNLKRNIPPLAEPKLVPLLRKNQKAGRLFYTNDFRVIQQCEVLWITLDTPVAKDDTANNKIIFYALKKALPHLKDNVLVIVSSQMPVGSSKQVQSFIRKKRPDISCSYAYIPENLQLGKAVESFFNPSRIVIGAEDKGSAQKARSLFRGLKAEFLVMNIASAEMVKHALNSYLATSLSFIYDIADICEKVGADVTQVSRALKTDPRIGKGAYLDASIGFSGGTLGRDMVFLSATARQQGISLPVIDAAYRKNKSRYHLVVKVLKEVLDTLLGKKIAVWGITYKPGTSTLRRSLALSLSRELSKNGAQLSFADPLAKKNEIVAEMGKAKFSFSRTPLSSAKGCHAIIIMTPWKGLEKINLKQLRNNMKKPAIIFDSRNFFADKRDLIKEAGLMYRGIGIKEN